LRSARWPVGFIAALGVLLIMTTQKLHPLTFGLNVLATGAGSDFCSSSAAPSTVNPRSGPR
jgi:hypothetical protein